MISIIVHWLIFLFFTNRVYGDLYDNRAVPPNQVVLVPNSVYPCGEQLLKIDLNLRDVGDIKVLDGLLDLDEELNEEYTLQIIIDKWNNGGWEDDFYTIEGRSCELLNRYGANIWKNLKEQAVPPLEGDCTVAPGHYEVKDFRAAPEDFSVPVMIVGKYRVTIRIYDPSGTEMACQIVEADVNRKY